MPGHAHAPRRWRNLIPVFDGLAPGAPFERSKIFQALIDVGALIFGVFFLCVAASSIGASFYILFFVRTG